MDERKYASVQCLNEKMYSLRRYPAVLVIVVTFLLGIWLAVKS